MEAPLGLKKGAWTAEEDDRLRKCVEKYGEGKWHRVPFAAGLNRCRKSCRLRWLNYLSPNINREKFTVDEVDLMMRMHKLLGNRWSLIAGRLPGRTANDIKNYWNTHLRKKDPNYFLNKNDRECLHIEKVNAIKPQARAFSKNMVFHDDKSSFTSDHNQECLVLDQDNLNFQPLMSSVYQSDDETTWWQSLLDDKQMDHKTPSSSINAFESSSNNFVDKNFDYNEVNNVMVDDNPVVAHDGEKEENFRILTSLDIDL